MMETVLLGELPSESTGTPPSGYDSSGVNPDLEVTETKDEPDTSSNNWMMYLGLGVMVYVLLLKKK
jgi:hypothetical protein